MPVMETSHRMNPPSSQKIQCSENKGPWEAVSKACAKKKNKTLYAISFKNEDPNRTPEKRDSMWGCVMKTDLRWAVGHRGDESIAEVFGRRSLSKSLLLRRRSGRELDSNLS